MMNIIDELKRMDTKKNVILVFTLISISVFVFQNNQSGFDQGHHGFLSSHGAAIAKNLSVKHNFLMYESISINEKEELTYQTYSRFPVTAFLIVKAFMHIFSPNLSMEIIVARQLMNLFFIGAMLFAVFSVYELTRSYLGAMAITFLSFSSFYLNFYNDMIFNDTPTLFGFVMTFHGIVIYHLYHRKRQLFLKSVTGLLLGWHIFSILLAYISISLLIDFVHNRSLLPLIRSDQFKLGLISLLTGLFLLGFNFVNEAMVTGKPLFEIGSFKSAKSRMGQNNTFQQQYSEYLEWGAFTKEQLNRIGAMSIPFILKDSGDFKLAGGVIVLLTFIGCCFSKCKILSFTLLFSGFLWAYPMRGYTFSHDYQSIYYIGVPILFFSTIVNGIKTKLPAILPVIFIFSIYSFIATNITFNQSKAAGAEKVNLVTYEFQKIIDYTKDGNIFFIDGVISEIAYGYHAVEFYLSGNFFTEDKNFAEYIISRNQNFNGNPLTPKNSNIFLFRGAPYFAKAFNRRGLDYYRKGDYGNAIADFNLSLQKDIGFVEAYVNRGITRKKMGDYKSAIEDYNKALELKPDTREAINNLAWLLATCPDYRFRDGEKAVSMAKKGIDLNPGAYALDTLAAAYAEEKNFEMAVKKQREAIRILKNLGKTNAIKECEKHLEAYKARRAWRDSL